MMEKEMKCASTIGRDGVKIGMGEGKQAVKLVRRRRSDRCIGVMVKLD